MTNEDLLTEEQQKLETLRTVLAATKYGLKIMVEEKNSYAEGDVKAAFIAGQIDQRELFIEALEKVLNKKPEGWTEIEC